MARQDLTDYIIEILEGPAAGVVIPLSGRKLPYRAGAGGTISYGRTQRSKLTWYPGNRVASQQVIGPVLKPTSINGIWKDRYLGTDQSIDLVETFEELLDSGVQVRVFWSTIERQGIVKDFTWTPGIPTGGLSDIGWVCMFEWNSAGVPPPRRVGESDITLRDGVIRAAGALSSLGQALEDFVTGSNLFVGIAQRSFQASKRAINALLEEMESPLKTLSSAAARLGNEPNLPARFVEDASTACETTQRTSGETAELISAIFAGNVIVSDSFEDILDEALLRYDLSEEAFNTAREAFIQRVRLEEIIRPPEFATVTPVIGSDLREIAIRFYGDADLWDRIAKQNGLEQSIIPDTVKELVIPLSLPDATDQKLGC